MGALHVLQVVDWSKYTLDEWLAQYGSWCDNNPMRSGNSPNALEVSQSYYLMASTGAVKPNKPRKACVTCQLTDTEARAIGRILSDALLEDSHILKVWIASVINNKVSGYSMDDMAEYFGISKSSVSQDVKCGIAFLHGRNKFLAITT